MLGIIWSPLNGGNQQSIIKGPREYEGYYVLVAWWREKERRCWDFIESMSISKGDKQTHGNAETNWNENWGNKWTPCMCLNAVHTAAMIIGPFWYWFWVDDHQIDVDTCAQEIHGQTANIPPNYTVLAFHFYFYQSSPFIQKELIKPWVSSELGAGPVYGRGGERTGELCSWQMAHNGGRQRTWIHFGWLWISQVLTFNGE